MDLFCIYGKASPPPMCEDECMSRIFFQLAKTSPYKLLLKIKVGRYMSLKHYICKMGNWRVIKD